MSAVAGTQTHPTRDSNIHALGHPHARRHMMAPSATPIFRCRLSDAPQRCGGPILSVDPLPALLIRCMYAIFSLVLLTTVQHESYLPALSSE